MASPPILWDIESDPVLANVKLIAEAWDAGGLYQVGQFVGDSWKEWNGQFRDDVRSFHRLDKVPGPPEWRRRQAVIVGGSAHQPPSTPIAWPVTKAASSEAR